MVYSDEEFFTPEGKLSIIKTKGEGGNRLNRPHGLCVDGSGILYVTERDNDTSNGRFLGYIGDSDGSSFNSHILSYQTSQVDCTSMIRMEWSSTSIIDHCISVFDSLFFMIILLQL